ncbi:MAG: M48 family metallopeptidase [Elainellaceae cyanobacterium]
MPTYTGISNEAFRHPLDYQAEQALRSVPGFDVVARKFMEVIYERPQNIYLLGNCVEVGPRQYASLYRIFRECLRDLDVYPQPLLFVAQSPQINAFALGQERPSITLNTGLIDCLNEDAIRAVIAHELGHVKCGHTTLTQMAIWAIATIAGLAEATLGLSMLISTGLILGFYEWLRKAELSADRAAMLVTDDLNLVMTMMMQMAGGSSRYAHEMSLDEFLRQADRYQDLDIDNLNQVYKFLLYNNLSQGVFLTHPFAVERVHYLKDWADSADYRQIRRGNYRRSGEGSVDVSAEPSGQTPAEGQEVDRLRQQIDDLQREINQIKRSRDK